MRNNFRLSTKIYITKYKVDENKNGQKERSGKKIKKYKRESFHRHFIFIATRKFQKKKYFFSLVDWNEFDTEGVE